MEDFPLLFGEGTECVVVAVSKEVFTCRGFGGFSKVFGEFVDRITGVFFHVEGDLAWDRVVAVHASIFVFFFAIDAQFAIDSLEPFNDASDYLW